MVYSLENRTFVSKGFDLSKEEVHVHVHYSCGCCSDASGVISVYENFGPFSVYAEGWHKKYLFDYNFEGVPIFTNEGISKKLKGLPDHHVQYVLSKINTLYEDAVRDNLEDEEEISHWRD